MYLEDDWKFLKNPVIPMGLQESLQNLQRVHINAAEDKGKWCDVAVVYGMMSFMYPSRSSTERNGVDDGGSNVSHPAKHCHERAYCPGVCHEYGAPYPFVFIIPPAGYGM